MRKEMIETAAFEVATQVRAVEDTIESALAELAELQGRMVRARATFGIATATGHEAFEQLAVAMKGLVKARGGMANCHIAMKETTQFVPGLQLTTSIGHILKGVDQDLLPRAYGAALQFWSYPILVILAVGTYRSHRRLQQSRA
jgi:hypothetical protein